MQITVGGMGAGDDMLLPPLTRALEQAALLLGAPRLLAQLEGRFLQAERLAAVDAAALAKALLTAAQGGVGSAVVLMSGDTGFYSGAAPLLARLAAQGQTAELLPGISTVQLLAARLKRPWQNWRLYSLHGRTGCAAAEAAANPETFFLTGGAHTPEAICEELTQAGLGDCAAVVAQQLGCAQESIVTDTVARCAAKKFAPPAVLLVQNPMPQRPCGFGLPDEAFLRGGVPMTKAEVRAVALARLQLQAQDVFYDVGAGTGSVAVEAARVLGSGGMAYAIERGDEACALIRQNAVRLGGHRLQLVQGVAPAAFAGLPTPSCAFVGGSGGALEEILAALLHKNPGVRVVVSAVTLQTQQRALALLQGAAWRDFGAVQLAANRLAPLGKSQMLAAQNPVTLFWATGVGATP